MEMLLEWASSSISSKKNLHVRGVRKNNFRKAIDRFWICHMVFTPLASLPSGIDLKRIFKNVGHKAETSRVATGSQ
jgi:hypothetical protein